MGNIVIGFIAGVATVLLAQTTMTVMVYLMLRAADNDPEDKAVVEG